jgi:DNA-binding GntR family transcriptional regulator
MVEYRAEMYYGGGQKDLLGRAVVATVRDKILQGTIHPGDRLQIGPLSAQLGISVTPVREALLQLSQDGWLTHEVHRGFRVAPIDPQDVSDTYWLWAQVEHELGRRVAERATPDDVRELRQLDGQLRDLRDHHTELAFALNQQLHSVLHRIADSPKLASFANAALRSVPLHLSETFPSLPGWAEVNRFGHTPIVDAIEAGDGDTAAALLADHYIQTGDILLRELELLGLWDPAAGASVDQCGLQRGSAGHLPLQSDKAEY